MSDILPDLFVKYLHRQTEKHFLFKKAEDNNIHVQIDLQGAWNLSQELVKATPKESHGFIDGDAFAKRTMKDLSGRTYLVTFVLAPINDWLQDFHIQSVSGLIDKDVSRDSSPEELLSATIGLYINDWNLGRQLEIINYDELSEKAQINKLTEESRNALNNLRYQHVYRALIHELTHLVDPEEVEDPFAPESLADISKEDMVAYYNQPREIRAHFQEILDEVIAEYEDGDTGDLVLEKSPQWIEMKPFLTIDNQNAIKNAIAKWLLAIETE